MYNELYAAWLREIENASLGGLPPDFYSKLGNYLKRISEENLQDQKSVKINLLQLEAQNVMRMLEELLDARYKKIVKVITENQKVPSELLTFEEARMAADFAAFSGAYQKFSQELLQGQVQIQSQTTSIQVQAPIPTVTIKAPTAPAQVQSAPITVKLITESSHKRVVLRFTKNIPGIIGADMKTYGPFVAEDVASLPVENAKMLVKQGLAMLVEAQ
jgi:DNA replication initiation complex subunit (GINS family)